MNWDEKKVHDKLNTILDDDSSSVIIHSERNVGSSYVLTFSLNDTNGLIIGNILRGLQCDITFHFFDYFHPQLSDPGAYVTVMKSKEGSLCYRLGNHGWQSDINSITYERAVRYIMKNIEYNNSPEQYNSFSMNFGRPQSLIDPKEERINFTRLKETSKKILKSKVYEINNSYLVIVDESHFINEVFYLFKYKKSKRKIYRGYYLTEESYRDFYNKDSKLSIKESVDRTIEVKIRKYN